jgi:hypothetical protein
VPDFVSWWGAVTGSVATTVAVRREVIARRVRVRVDHGWRYLLSDDQPPRLHDMLVYVMVSNIGGRKVAVQHVGWEWMLDSGERTEGGGTVWHVHRAEVPLREPALLEPDGVPLKVEVYVGQLLHLVDPFDTPVRPIAFTGGGHEERRGPVGLLAQRVPPRLDRDQLLRRFEELRAEAKQPRASGHEGLYALDPIWLDGEGSTGDR